MSLGSPSASTAVTVNNVSDYWAKRLLSDYIHITSHLGRLSLLPSVGW